MQKGPAMFKNDENFCNKWKAILNKCSYDLMLLVIEQSIATVEITNTEIDTLQDTLRAKYQPNDFDEKLKQLEMEVNNFEKKTRETKLRKFERDKRDFNNSRVYNWTFTDKVKKRVTWADSDLETTDGDDSAGTSADEETMLRRPPDRTTKQRARDAFFQLRPSRRGKKKA